MDTLEILYVQGRVSYTAYTEDWLVPQNGSKEESPFLSRIKPSSSTKQRFISEEFYGDVKESNITKHWM
jgi:hypothetical protein